MRAEDADLPLLAHDDPAFACERFHEVLDDLASRGWLARSDLGYLVLGREPGMALLKDRRLSFPAVELLELQGLTDGIIYDGTTKGLMAQSGQPHALDHPGNLGGSDTWEDSGPWRHSGSIRRSCVNAQ